MHLLAAQPGGFVDDEGIIDLDQDPAEVVILAAADSALAALSGALERFVAPEGGSLPQVRLANWVQLLKPAAYDLYEHKVLEQARVVVVSLLGGASYWRYGFERLQAWAEADPSRTLVIVPGDDAVDPELFEASSVAEPDCHRVWRYLREGGVDNSRELLNYIAAEYFGLALNWREPRPLPHCLLYLPCSAGQASFAEWQAYRDQLSMADERPIVALLFYRSHLQSDNTAMFDGLIAALEQAGLCPLPVAIASLKDAESLLLVNRLIERSGAKLIINSTGFASNTVASPELSSQPTRFESPFEQPLPVLQLVLSSSTEQDWLDHKQGLRSRDIAMQVVLPEMDGRIHTRALSFKSESHFDLRGQLSVVRYALHPERADFVARLALAHCGLASKPNPDKRIALILANYPTKDGRIGNGVGLDTPASTVNILRALHRAGYPLGDEAGLPEDGDSLIRELLGAVTNNPNTLHQRHCWQSIALEDYQRAFAELPDACQQAVLQRWGGPEMDPKCRNGRLMLAGIRLGETFIGIQPARGFNLDLAANYHDPDLIPPHSYLAFYFWLRHCYGVDAVVHVGKHGNLEWLPGKGSALSAECWPDIALGPMPHFYPFIVNDPGEGAQAKRRTQAVVIDHLMPPMSRAETYAELAELEGLVDEYYQAMGMDDQRQGWLRQQIIEQVRKTHLDQELASEAGDDDEALLNELDAYLCDIKEAQIRHGLHILGELPRPQKLAETLVALLRLPRGDGAEAQGILHNLALDLALQQDGEPFEPLEASVQPWQGERPEVLQQVCDSHWRSEADTRERLELLAQQLIEQYLLSDSDSEPFTELAGLPRTRAQLDYARATLMRALNLSAEQEIGALLDGLEGRFVDPGPSGAPTRGRLDTLPTGRNFYSVDNRSIPSPAAWAIGQRSAQALIERHLQEHGDYPTQLGLSVWGTATMRTGGDDIAQAFALMGVRPIWAPGSNRVVDFELISCQQLGRPRVDVTLRVSGFFRDAFPNVMRLFDATVRKLAELDEPGDGNRIRAHIEQRQAQLQTEGLDPAEAARQASYRVFGSKPGAYGAGLQGLIDERCWEQRSDLAEAYLNWGGYAYGDHQAFAQAGTAPSDGSLSDGVEAPQAFQHRLSQLEVVIQNQDNREHDLLDSDDYYQFQGGMSNAVEQFAGKAPQIYHGDHANPMQPKIRTLKEELNRVIRSRLLNPKWLTAMREHGYKGAFEMSASVDYLFAYDATTELIDDYQYQQVSETLLFEPENRQFLEQHNPDALEEIAERLLEATQRGLWSEPGEQADKLQDLLLELDQRQEQAT
ncbi:cobaltochelatase subunit CobN [Motiliproteus coralliicola]|uniref:Cobaltochelatase subunit CobN n=1 Tax=Motiliproteus coralliicola TaxID=2283196 RepID=A0A369WFL2_9GAMM|nr:cobaltochelatase subunit CobN [Motiliproteus coralliicola]RDE18265.1 cobaltochelatase subunit CobN [Motiliproteus coralliicola]